MTITHPFFVFLDQQGQKTLIYQGSGGKSMLESVAKKLGVSTVTVDRRIYRRQSTTHCHVTRQMTESGIVVTLRMTEPVPVKGAA